MWVVAVVVQAGILTVAVVTRPFRFEGAHRMRLAEEGIRRLQDSVDTLIVIPNQNLFKMVDQSTTLLDAFRYWEGDAIAWPRLTHGGGGLPADC